jgi:hypothetical protein
VRQPSEDLITAGGEFMVDTHIALILIVDFVGVRL